MQAQGIAEADPSLDVDGWDAAAKAAALANVLLDARHRAARRRPDRHRPLDRGLGTGGPGSRPTGAPRCAPQRGGPASRTNRWSYHENDLLAGLQGMANALVLETDTLGRGVVISQLDGGLMHTAYALLSDLITRSEDAPVSDDALNSETRPQITGTGFDSAASTSLYRYLAPSMPSSGPSSYSSANVPL